MTKPWIQVAWELNLVVIDDWMTVIWNTCKFITARKWSLGQGNVFTPECHSVHRGEGGLPNSPVCRPPWGWADPPGCRPPSSPGLGRPPGCRPPSLPGVGQTPWMQTTFPPRGWAAPLDADHPLPPRLGRPPLMQTPQYGQQGGGMHTCLDAAGIIDEGSFFPHSHIMVFHSWTGKKTKESAKSFNLKSPDIFTGRNEVVAKVMFLQVSVCPQGGGGCLPQCMLGCQNPPLGPGRPPQNQADTPLDQADPPGPGRHPPGTRQTPPQDQWDPPSTGTGRPPPPGSRLQHTVYERLVRILLECILVNADFAEEWGISGGDLINDTHRIILIYYNITGIFYEVTLCETS